MIPITATAHCIRRCDWHAAGDWAVVDRQAEKHTRGGHPTATMAEPATTTSAGSPPAAAPTMKGTGMTSTTETTAHRVHVRRHGYATLQEIHSDHSATVRSDDGTEQHVPFGDWVYAATSDQYDAKTAIGVKKFIADALKRDLGDDFIVTGEILGPGHVTSFLAKYGPSYTIEVKITGES